MSSIAYEARRGKSVSVQDELEDVQRRRKLEQSGAANSWTATSKSEKSPCDCQSICDGRLVAWMAAVGMTKDSPTY